MQPGRNHFPPYITERRKDQRPGNRAHNIERQKNFGRQMAGANQYRPDNAKAIHKARANDEQVGMTLNEPLSAADFLLMLCETLEQRGPKAQPQKVEQLIAYHPAQRDRGNNQRELQ